MLYCLARCVNAIEDVKYKKNGRARQEFFGTNLRMDATAFTWPVLLVMRSPTGSPAPSLTSPGKLAEA